MKNHDLITFEYFKENKFLYIENDLILSDLDRDNMESVLGGMGKFADLDDYKIEYLFDAYSNKDTFSKIEEYDNILLNTHFIGVSSALLVNFCKGAKIKNLKNKKIFNCANLYKKSSIMDDMHDLLEDLHIKNNITFYIVKNLNCFEKI